MPLNSFSYQAWEADSNTSSILWTRSRGSEKVNGRRHPAMPQSEEEIPKSGNTDTVTSESVPFTAVLYSVLKHFQSTRSDTVKQAA